MSQPQNNLKLAKNAAVSANKGRGCATQLCHRRLVFEDTVRILYVNNKGLVHPNVVVKSKHSLQRSRRRDILLSNAAQDTKTRMSRRDELRDTGCTLFTHDVDFPELVDSCNSGSICRVMKLGHRVCFWDLLHDVISYSVTTNDTLDQIRSSDITSLILLSHQHLKFLSLNSDDLTAVNVDELSDPIKTDLERKELTDAGQLTRGYSTLTHSHKAIIHMPTQSLLPFSNASNAGLIALFAIIRNGGVKVARNHVLTPCIVEDANRRMIKEDRFKNGVKSICSHGGDPPLINGVTSGQLVQLNSQRLIVNGVVRLLLSAEVRHDESLWELKGFNTTEVACYIY
ncbi:hypothetical protein D9C73_022811 [Collichthys lucidus]|uniref:Uncharacterized protein n=1 Tax=Collichthys lucidus TaxID=240159 RepID=A0A4U5VKB3_COLLU|nr:hypothetical protein D9C73_022811 [Collichthys lucidus]